MNKPLSFAIGDVVHLNGSKKEHIVETPHMNGEYLEYFVTDHGFWESGNKLTLIRRADKESLKKLVDLYKEEYENEEE